MGVPNDGVPNYYVHVVHGGLATNEAAARRCHFVLSLLRPGTEQPAEGRVFPLALSVACTEDDMGARWIVESATEF